MRASERIKKRSYYVRRRTWKRRYLVRRKDEVNLMLEIQGYRCFHCHCAIHNANHKDPNYATVDHVTPVALIQRGQPNHRVLSCKDCNVTRGCASFSEEDMVRYYDMYPMSRHGEVLGYVSQELQKPLDGRPFL